MKYYSVNICPKLDSGLCNQIYALIASICFCIENKINILFIDKFYKEINTDCYCNINNILDLNKMNLFLSNYEIFLVDSKDFSFNIEFANILDNRHNKLCDLTNEIREYLKDNVFVLTSDNILNIPVKRLWLFDIIYLQIKYNLNNGYFQEIYPIKNNKLIDNIDYNFHNLQYNITDFVGNKHKYFWEILSNIEFADEFVQNANRIKKEIVINNSSKVNCIHLRLENDFIDHYASKTHYKNTELLKNIIENKYIEVIKENIKKDEQTIILTSDLNNNVIKFLNENNYKYITTQKVYNYRELNAIVDLEIGLICNNILILVYESSFSYTLKHKLLKNNKNVKIYELTYVNILNNYFFP